jgi:hypothetical protein
VLLDLAHQGGEIEVDAAGWDFSGCEIVLVEGAAGNLDGFVGGGMLAKGPLCMASKLHSTATRFGAWTRIAGGVDVAGKTSDDGNDEAIADGGFSAEPGGEMKDDVVGVVAKDFVDVGAFSGVEVFLDKRADIFMGSLHGGDWHWSSFPTKSRKFEIGWSIDPRLLLEDDGKLSRERELDLLGVEVEDGEK